MVVMQIIKAVGKGIKKFMSSKVGKILPYAGIAAVGTYHVVDKNKTRKKQEEKDRLTQKSLKKLQAEINALKTEKEREEYKKKLLKEAKKRKLEV